MYTRYFPIITLVFGLVIKVQTECEASWTAYKDEKCFKILDQVVTQENALSLCQSAIGGKMLQEDDEGISPLLTIKSPEEQEFITKFIFQDLQVVDNVWLGATRFNETSSFKWPDDSSLFYTNWHEGNPSTIPGNDCTQILPKGILKAREQEEKQEESRSRAEVDGLWSDVSCLKRNLVACQKLQPWSLTKLQKRHLYLEANPVPIGFVHVQLPDQPDPRNIWPNVQWINITKEYAGLFFRAEGGNSAAFGTIQDESTRQITRMQYANEYSGYVIDVPKSGWSPYIIAGAHSSSLTADEGLRVETSDSEVRPRNTAVLIWKRVS